VRKGKGVRSETRTQATEMQPKTKDCAWCVAFKKMVAGFDDALRRTHQGQGYPESRHTKYLQYPSLVRFR
jgi:hypothetical protein